MNKHVWHCIGLMSGTSLDGIDICYVKFNVRQNYDYKILKAVTVKYPDNWKLKLKNAFTEDLKSIGTLDLEYGNYITHTVKSFIDENSIDNLDFIASHGHTIFHKPEEGLTLQIGDGQTIANKVGVTVVCDFRTQDVQLGGQGAPLVPIGDELLFSEYQYCLNLGGFANISFKHNKKRIAFDVCPVNIVLNHYAQKEGYAYDTRGNLAGKGMLNQKLLNELNAQEFYKKDHPKSLGLEWVKEHIFPLIDAYRLTTNDVLRTYVEHVAFQIAKIIRKDSSLLVTGGGAYNSFLINRIGFFLENEISLPENSLIDFKEALIFAFLGLLKLQDKVNVLSSVTGARTDHSSGVVYNVKNWE